MPHQGWAPGLLLPCCCCLLPTPCSCSTPDGTYHSLCIFVIFSAAFLPSLSYISSLSSFCHQIICCVRLLVKFIGRSRRDSSRVESSRVCRLFASYVITHKGVIIFIKFTSVPQTIFSPLRVRLMTYACAAFSTDDDGNLYAEFLTLSSTSTSVPASTSTSISARSLVMLLKCYTSFGDNSLDKSVYRYRYIYMYIYINMLWYIFLYLSVGTCRHFVVSSRSAQLFGYRLDRCAVCPGKVAIDVPPITSACSTFAPQATR